MYVISKQPEYIANLWNTEMSTGHTKLGIVELLRMMNLAVMLNYSVINVSKHEEMHDTETCTEKYTKTRDKNLTRKSKLVESNQITLVWEKDRKGK